MCIWLVAALAQGDKCDFFLAEIVQRIESPMAFWLGTVIEKGQLAYSRSGHELTGEIWSWGLPEEKGVWEKYLLAKVGQQHSTIHGLKSREG